jgi:hypothetical protein
MAFAARIDDHTTKSHTAHRAPPVVVGTAGGLKEGLIEFDQTLF